MDIIKIPKHSKGLSYEDMTDKTKDFYDNYCRDGLLVPMEQVIKMNSKIKAWSVEVKCEVLINIHSIKNGRWVGFRSIINKTQYTIGRFRDIHGTKYDYTKVNYTGDGNKVIISCDIHGDFKQSPSHHMRGQGCQECGIVSAGNSRRLTTEEFIERSINTHGNKYDYSKTNYIKDLNKVIIICDIHGDFKQSPSHHMRGQGCRKCANISIGNSKRSNTDDFIKKSIEIHGDKYDYSKVEYTGNNNKVTIICQEHDEFTQKPSDHLIGSGCRECGIISTGNLLRSNTEEFIKKSIEIHGDKYDYSKVDYTGNNNKVIIICKDHGEFTQKPQKHLNAHGCRECGIISTGNLLRSNTEEFIKKSIELHGDKYDYSKVDYTSNNNKVTIICDIHGEFIQKPQKHLNAHGCQKCANISTGNLLRSNTEEFIKKSIEIHGDKYDYSKVDYAGNKNKVIIICKDHGEFTQKPQKHLNAHGCQKCANILRSDITRSNTEEFIQKSIKIHGNKYDYSKVDYTGSHSKVIIICKDHGEFKQASTSHLSGNACPVCKISKGEILINEYLNEKKIIFINQKRFKDCRSIRPLPFDFHLPNHNLCIEYDGRQHFISIPYWGGDENLKNVQKHDKIKTDYCRENGINLLRIPYTEIDNINEILDNYLNKFFVPLFI